MIRENVINIVGITEGSVKSLGTILSSLIFKNNTNIELEFTVVPDNFPIPVDGIIGKDFLKKYKCSLDYLSMNFTIRYKQLLIETPITDTKNEEKYHLIPPRCEVIKLFRLITDTTNDHVIDNTEIFPGVFIASAIVNPQNCFLRILNTNNRPVEVKKILKLSAKDFNEYQILSIEQHTNNREDALMKILSKNIPEYAPQSLSKLCKSYADIFTLPGDIHSVNNFYKQKLTLSDESAVYVKNYRYPHSQKDEINNQVSDMLKNKIIEPSTSNYNSPIILVPKKAVDGHKKYRLCIDFRQLNKKLIPDKFPLPRIDEILDSLGRTIYFSKLDLYSGFWQVPLDKKSKHLTSFSTSQGSYQFNVLPFGLNVAPNSFARMMAIAFSGLESSTAFIYLDDVIVIGMSEKHHTDNLNRVFETCRKKNLKLNPAKCEFMKTEILFLGHKCTREGILPDNSKFQTIQDYPAPKDKDGVKRFVAFCNYYRKFIPKFGVIASPLNALTGKTVKFIWTDECQIAFETLKHSLINPPVLQYPDFSKEFILTVDASKQGIGAVLSQLSDKGDDLPIAFASSGFSKADKNKPPIIQELLAIYFGITQFRPYLFGNRFTVRSDHKPLSYLFSMKDPTSKLARIRTELTEYNFIIEYIKGTDNVAADALSRMEFKDIRNIQNINEQILVTTRSKAKENEKAKNSDTQKSKESKVRFALNNMAIKKYPLLSFNMIDQEISFSIRSARLLKSHTFSFNPKNVTVSLRPLLTELDNICSKKDLKYLRIDSNDAIFEKIKQEEFIKQANEIIKTSIYIMQPITEIESADQRNELISHFHDHIIEGGHVGQKRLYAKLRSRYKWKGMAKDIAKYIKKCSHCQINKPKVKNKETLQLTETPTRPFQSISIDTIGPFNTTTNQLKYAITIICEFSKYLIIVPVPNKESKTIAKCLMNSCILTFGNVERIRSDMGTEYVNQTMQHLSELLEIKHDKSTAYHHETMGTIERSHRTLNEYLRTYMNNNKDWPRLIKYFEYCFNTTPNTSIEMYTPFELVFGRIPINLMHKINNKNVNLNITEYVNNIRHNLEIAFKKTEEYAIANKIKSKIYYDSTAKPLEVNVGDNVLLVNEVRNKFDSLYKDDYLVMEINNHNVTIKNKKTQKTSIVHKNRLRKR